MPAPTRAELARRLSNVSSRIETLLPVITLQLMRNDRVSTKAIEALAKLTEQHRQNVLAIAALADERGDEHTPTPMEEHQ